MKRRRQPPRRLVVTTAVAGAFAIGFVEIAVLFRSHDHRGAVGRRLSAILSSTSSSTSSSSHDPIDQCEIKSPQHPPHSIQPTWAASYPGSGAKMSWNLVSALSGLPTTDDRRINGLSWDRVATVKTHYPQRKTVNVASVDKIHFPRAILITRHPKDAIPSYYNHLYEKQNNIAEHSTRAPLEDWITWRDQNFIHEMEEWANHAKYWLDAYPHSGLNGDRLVVTYEGITDDLFGPIYAQSISQFLDKSDGVDTVELDEAKVACVWRKIVKYKEGNGGGGGSTSIVAGENKIVNPSSRRSGSKYRPYTNEQLYFMIEKLEQLRNQYIERNDDIVSVMDSYLDTARLARAENDQGREAPAAAAAAASQATAIQ